MRNLIGQRFCKLLVIGVAERKKGKGSCFYSMWHCKCDCGEEKDIYERNLIRGKTRSCGCLRRLYPNHKTHGMQSTPFYAIYRGLWQRCNYLKHNRYKIYGGRGIKCLRNKFEEFRDDMYMSYLEHSKIFGGRQTTIERINRDGNYCKENCKRATQIEQQNNRKDNHLIVYNGKSQTLAQWGRELNLNPNLIGLRLKKGYVLEKALYAGKFKTNGIKEGA